jgi:hypothetical protein
MGAFAIVLFVALLGVYYSLKHFPRKKKPKGKVHFIPEDLFLTMVGT